MGVFGNLFGNKNKEKELSQLEQEIELLKQERDSLTAELDEIYSGINIVSFDDITSEEYKMLLKENREKQKELIRIKDACDFPGQFTFNNSLAEGKKVVNDTVRQLVRSFNNECDVIINKVTITNYENNKVTITNYENSKDKIKKSFEVLNKLNSRMFITLTNSYLNLKLEELDLFYKYELKKQEDKERAREERERLREEAKLQKEIEEARKSIHKEKIHFTQALEKITKQLENNPNDVELLNKKAELEAGIEETDKKLADVDYRQQNTRAGYVYIISNIGAFGKDVYKIGMTRRLEPLDRIIELGDASVPFAFDVHAMIFTNDAPTLENALHKAFENNRINSVNYRKEFFKVSIDEIEKVVKENFKEKTVEFIKEPQAEQYYLSIKNNI